MFSFYKKCFGNLQIYKLSLKQTNKFKEKLNNHKNYLQKTVS